ncbi:hypothetical protein MMPV_006297 [Pyropia vietnamensis]
MDTPSTNTVAAAAALTRPAALPYTLTPAFATNTGPVVVLMSGWPDRPATLFASLLGRLDAAGYRTALVELPGYAPDEERPLPPRWWGWDFPQVIAGYAAAVQAIQKAAVAGQVAAGGGSEEATNPSTPLPPVTFVTHDWGAVMTWRLVAAHPSLVRAIVAADVGDVTGMSTIQVLFCALYMSTLAALFVLGGPVGDAATRGLARLLGAPYPDAAAARMNSFYYWTVRRQVGLVWSYLTGRGGGRAEETGLLGPMSQRSVVPVCPTMYLYGTQKGTFQYHSREWLANLNARPDCQVVPLNDIHWLMVGPAAAEYEAAVLGWLATTIGSQGAPVAPAASAVASLNPAVPVSKTSAPAGEGKTELGNG